jgi:hypothetical protein
MAQLLYNEQKTFLPHLQWMFLLHTGKICLLDIYILLKGWKLTESNFHHSAFTCHLQFVSIIQMPYLVHTEREKDSMKTVNSDVSATNGYCYCYWWSGPRAKAPVALQPLGLLYTLFSRSSHCRRQMSPCPMRRKRSKQREVELNGRERVAENFA